MRSIDRITEFDEARGLAMILVCLSHFWGLHLVINEMDSEGWVSALLAVTKVAAPMFVLISGMLLGYQLQVRNDARVFRLRVLDRALFLLTVGHMLIAIPGALRYGGLGPSFMRGFMTDTLAVCLVVGVLVMPLVKGRHLIFLGGAGMMAEWLVWALWVPDAAWAHTVSAVFIGPVSGDPVFFNFPLLPWVAWYLVGCGIGKRMDARQPMDRLQAGRQFRIIGAGMAGAALLCKGASIAWLSMTDQPMPSWWVFVWAADQKLPPGPMYVLLYSGLGLGLMGLLFASASRGFAYIRTSVFVSIGQSSLVIFIVQAYLYYGGLYALKLADVTLTPVTAMVYLALSLLIVWGCAKVLTKYGVMQYMTLGIARCVARGSPHQRSRSV